MGLSVEQSGGKAVQTVMSNAEGLVRESGTAIKGQQEGRAAGTEPTGGEMQEMKTVRQSGQIIGTLLATVGTLAFALRQLESHLRDIVQSNDLI